MFSRRVRLRIVFVAAVVAVGAAGCRPDSLTLVYDYEPGTILRYRMTAHAQADWNILGRGSGSYRVVFDITERISSVQDDTAVVDVTLSPVEVTEQNLPPPGSEERSFSLRVGPSGEVLEILEVNGVAATNLDPDELSFIGTYRPPLPLGPVGLNDKWESQQQIELGSVSQKTVALGRLDSLGVDDSGPYAGIKYSGQGPLVWNLVLPQGEAELNGSASSRERAVLDIDGGLLRRARSSTRGEFRVDVARPGFPQVTGTLELELNLDLRLVG